MNVFSTLAIGELLFTTSDAIKPEKKEDTTMFPNYTVKSAGPALQGTPFSYWYFLFEGDQKKPLQGFNDYYSAMDKKSELQRKATEAFAHKLLRTEAMKAVSDVAELDVKTVTALVTERKDAEAALEAETKKLAKKAKKSFFTKTDDYDDEDLFV